MSEALVAPRTTKEAAEFLKAQRDGPLVWKALCLKLQRQARGLPAVYPSALAAQIATPVGESVTRLQDLKRGMVAFSDDSRDNNPWGHVYFIAGRNNQGEVLTWTNDAVRTGGVDVVPLSFFSKNWGDTFQFGATWLNGYHFDEFNKPVATRGSLGDNYLHAMEDIEKAWKYHKKKGHTKLAKALENDLARMKKKQDKFSN